MNFIYRFQNGLHAPHMLGNQLNPSSTMAQKMCDTLSQEMVAHSVFTQQEPSQATNLVGPQLLRPQQVVHCGFLNPLHILIEWLKDPYTRYLSFQNSSIAFVQNFVKLESI